MGQIVFLTQKGNVIDLSLMPNGLYVALIKRQNAKTQVMKFLQFIDDKIYSFSNFITWVLAFCRLICAKYRPFGVRLKSMGFPF